MAGRARDEGKEKVGGGKFWGWTDGENEEMRGEEERRSRVMAGGLPSNLINMVLGVASCSLSFHTRSAAERKRELSR